ncbi:ATP-binding protein [Candidatus Epulonipiscium viviparus]|uniref:DNA polymerase III subunit n=1 Tax=Candidatus Epulonipiscium viviparus TaxID=420336 RepID=UPI00016C0463|nr:DNA polymerase III subunit [Candidatus Epulopiscium viviparus]
MDIIGHQKIKDYFKKVIKINKISHSYIFEGNKGVGKKSLAAEIAKILLCEDAIDEIACGKCSACKMMDAKVHPDFIQIEKDTKITKIETIKEKLLKEVSIKPYKGKYKIFVIAEAETLRSVGQNAILKTIEEPPTYALIFLVTTNIEMLLPTIRSRCIHISFSGLSETELKDYCKKYSINNKLIHLKFAEGSIGKLKDNIYDEKFLDLRAEAMDYILSICSCNVLSLYKVVSVLRENKEFVLKILEFWKLFFRDMLLYKRIQATDLYFSDYINDIKRLAAIMQYSEISENIKNIDVASNDIQNNINAVLVIENLLLSFKKEKI